MAKKDYCVTKREIIQQVLTALKGADLLTATNGVGWLGQSSGIQQQVEVAIVAWTQHNDPTPMQGVVALLETLNILTATEAKELQATILVA